MWIGLLWGLGACRPGLFWPRISTWVHGHGCRQGQIGLRPPAARAALVEAGAKASVGMVDPVCLLFFCGVTRRVRMLGPFLLEQKRQNPGIIFPDRADASRRRLRGRGREQPSVRTSATGHGLHLFSPETGLTGTYSGEAWKMAPSAAKVAGIASASCTS